MNFFLKMKLSILKNIAISLIEIERCHNRKTAKIGEPTRGHYDNAKPHVALTIRKKLLQLRHSIASSVLEILLYRTIICFCY